MSECALVLLAAFILDLILGDPVYPFHPVRLAGRAIQFFESTLRRIGTSGIFASIVLAIAVLILSLGFYLVIFFLAQHGHHGLVILWNTFLVYSLIALRDLHHHAGRVARALERNDLTGAQRAVQRMVGRDAYRLDAHAIARAAVESVAENFVDGVLSPLFWYVAGAAVATTCGVSPSMGAVIGMLTFKTVSTLDSMVGHRNERYIFFGRASARLDDVMNFLPARLSLLIMTAAALICRLDAKGCLRIGWRDRLKHVSPNSGHAESCMAGALGIRLGGPTIYPHGRVEKPWLGEGSADVSHEQIYQSRTMILCSGIITLILALLGLGLMS
jgi:adenosylcobinamide-phosphate synthase